MEREKHVDEGWKDAVSKQQETNKEGEGIVLDNNKPTDQSALDDQDSFMELNFLNYITSLAFQAMIFLGEIPNPMADNKIEINLKQAKFLIDTLILIREKTSGNLDKEEQSFLDSSIYELELKYVERSKTTLKI